jgi:serine/threonine protein phosphatase PrpC
MSKFCANCGAEVSDGFAFCEKCGTPVQAPENQAPSYNAPQYGPAASKMVIEDLTQWFNGLNLSKYAIDVDRTQMQQNSESLYKEIKEEILKIDKKLLDQYDGKAGTTVVLAFTTPGYTLFVNVGDSLAFVKTGNDYMQVTTLDAARGIPREIVEDYEAYRNFPYNHVVGNCLGMGIPGEVHHRFMDHSRPRRIVLTSDGVTDLVNEENFRNMVVGHATAKDITTKAAENPDKHVPNPLYDGVSHKMDDNISAIVIDIPENVKKGRTR